MESFGQNVERLVRIMYSIAGAALILCSVLILVFPQIALLLPAMMR